MTSAPVEDRNPAVSSCYGKHRFASAVIAWRAVRRRNRERAYFCRHCGGWHITGAHR